MSKTKVKAEQAEKVKPGAQPLTQKEALERDVTNFEIGLLNAIDHANEMAGGDPHSFDKCLAISIQCDADLRNTLPGNHYRAGLAVPRLSKKHGVVRKLILAAAQTQPLPRRGKDWRKLKPRRQQTR